MKMIITDTGFEGEGVGKVNDKVCFVRFALLGENVEVETYQHHSKYEKAKLLKVIEPSHKRIPQICPYFTKCGGCDFQHINYQDELIIKKNILQKQLKKLLIDLPIKINPSPKEFFYRNKIKLNIAEKGLALHSAYDNTLINITKCFIVNPKINQVIPILNQFILQNNISQSINFVEIKEIKKTTIINFFVKQELNISFESLIKKFKNDVAIFQTKDNHFKIIKGLKEIKFSPNSFHQINDEVSNLLYKKVCTFAGNKTIANCYSGAGYLSKMLLDKGSKKVFGLELGQNEHNDAQKLKKQFNLKFLENLKGDCAETLSKINNKLDLIIVDPPRAGCSKKVIDSIDQSSAKELIYISCNHASFARDIGRLKNFKLDQIELFDMFPKTANFEIFAHLNHL